MKISLNNKEIQISAISDLITLIGNNEDLEISIDNNGKFLIILLNKRCAFFVYMRYQGDSGYYSIGCENEIGKFESFILGNGQVDEYPIEWTIERGEETEKVIHDFFINAEMSSSIKWGKS